MTSPRTSPAQGDETDVERLSSENEQQRRELQVRIRSRRRMIRVAEATSAVASARAKKTNGCMVYDLGVLQELVAWLTPQVLHHSDRVLGRGAGWSAGDTRGRRRRAGVVDEGECGLRGSCAEAEGAQLVEGELVVQTQKVQLVE
jgi:hypothetical protein